MKKLNAGCGSQRLDGHIGLDIRLCEGTDVVCDLSETLPFVSDSVDHVFCKSLLEHMDDLESILSEFHRVLKPGGTLNVYVPHFTSPHAFADYTHRRFFSIKTFDHFSSPGRYASPIRYSSIRFHIDGVRILFETPFRVMRWMLKAVQLVVNIHPRTQLFYEYHLSTLVRCHAIEFKLTVPREPAA